MANLDTKFDVTAEWQIYYTQTGNKKGFEVGAEGQNYEVAFTDNATKPDKDAAITTVKDGTIYRGTDMATNTRAWVRFQPEEGIKRFTVREL